MFIGMIELQRRHAIFSLVGIQLRASDYRGPGGSSPQPTEGAPHGLDVIYEVYPA